MDDLGLEAYEKGLEERLRSGTDDTALTLAEWWAHAGKSADMLEGRKGQQAAFGRDLLAAKLSAIPLKRTETPPAVEPGVAKARAAIEKCLTDMSFTAPWGATAKMGRWHNLLEGALDALKETPDA